MRVFRRILFWLFLIVFIVTIGLVGWLYTNFSGGKPYDYTPAPPLLSTSDLQPFFAYPDPIGNVAASPDSNSRVFFTIHPESRPEKIKLCEIVNNEAKPFPSEAFQEKFETPLGLFVDDFNRLWVIDHGFHGFKGATLFGFDLNDNGAPFIEYTFSSEIAERGSFFNDLTVTPDGKYVFIADVSFFAKSPSIVVFDIENQRARNILEGHPSLSSEGFVPETPAKKMRFYGGLVDLMAGVDGIDIGENGAYLYFAAMTNSGLFKVPVNLAKNFDLDLSYIHNNVQLICKKPLSDGIRLDKNGMVYITDIEHQGIAVVDGRGKVRTLIQDKRIRWADGLSFGGDGFCYLADSDIPNQMMQTKAHIAAHAPYYIFRFRSGWY